MTLSGLINDIKRDSKIPTDEINRILIESIEDELCEEEVFKHLYKKAYGGHLSQALANDWVKMVGEHWTMEQTTEVGQKMAVDWNRISKCEFYALMNAWYSDNLRTAKKHSLESDAEYFADMVLDFFVYDTDAKNKNAFTYYFTFVA